MSWNRHDDDNDNYNYNNNNKGNFMENNIGIWSSKLVNGWFCNNNKIKIKIQINNIKHDSIILNGS